MKMAITAIIELTLAHARRCSSRSRVYRRARISSSNHVVNRKAAASAPTTPVSAISASHMLCGCCGVACGWYFWAT